VQVRENERPFESVPNCCTIPGDVTVVLFQLWPLDALPYVLLMFPVE
jgi:hypothetical protein